MKTTKHSGIIGFFLIISSTFINSNGLELIFGTASDIENTAINVSLSFKPVPDVLEELIFSTPVDNPVVTSKYGSRINPVTLKDGFHSGIDIDSFSSQNVYSVFDGVVIDYGFDDIYGNFIKIDHQNGYVSFYAHLLEFSFDDFVLQGEKIGIIGDTGQTTGSHLHFEIYKDGKLLDPCSVIDFYEN